MKTKFFLSSALLLLMATASSQGAYAAERVLSCSSLSHASYTAELFDDSSLGFSMHVEVGGALKYLVPLIDLHQNNFSMSSYNKGWYKHGQPMRNTSLVFSKIGSKQDEFILSERSFLPLELNAFDEGSVRFQCRKY